MPVPSGAGTFALLRPEKNNCYFLCRMGRIAGVTAEETRQRLVLAAARVVADQGYDGARVGEIAREAGLTTGAIYAHFRSKDELLRAATAGHGGAELGDLLGGARPAPLTADGDVVALLRVLARRLGQRPTSADSSFLVEAAVAAKRDPEVARRLRREVAHRESGLAVALRAAGDGGVVDPALPPTAVSRLALTFALGSLLVRALGLDPVDQEEWAVVADRLVDALLPEDG